MPGKIHYLKTRQEFKDFKENNKNFIIKFKAEWCAPCWSAEKIIKEYFGQCEQYLDMVVVDYNKGSDLFSYLKVKDIPSMHSFVNGEIAESVIGAGEKDLFTFFNSTMLRINKNVVLPEY